MSTQLIKPSYLEVPFVKFAHRLSFASCHCAFVCLFVCFLVFRTAPKLTEFLEEATVNATPLHAFSSRFDYVTLSATTSPIPRKTGSLLNLKRLSCHVLSSRTISRTFAATTRRSLSAPRCISPLHQTDRKAGL